MAANSGPSYKGPGLPRDEELVECLKMHAGKRAINVAALHAAQITQSESARVNGTLMDDFTHILQGNCVCLNNFLCTKGDGNLFNRLKSEVFGALKSSADDSSGLIDWSKHEVFENPTRISATFNAIVELLDCFFDVDVYASRLNYYRDGSTWKPFHHDSHAYGGRSLREDFTVGVSLGQTRHLEFLHEPSGKMFSIPQDNGDCFAFTSEVNSRFKHGVPKNSDMNCKDRFSIIVWGRRRSITSRNGGGVNADVSLSSRTLSSVDDALAAAHDLVRVAACGGMGNRAATDESTGSKSSSSAADKKKKKSRLQ